MTIERRKIENRQEWLQWRRSFVTASQVPALFGCHPYMTALRLYMEKSGVEFPNEETPVMRRGRLLESAVGQAVRDERPDWLIIKGETFYCDTVSRIGATPDFLVENGDGSTAVLQCKTCAPSVWNRDWNDGKEVPFWIVLQALTEAMMVDTNFAVIACMRVDPNDLACSIHELQRHAGSEAKIINAVRQFWDDVEHGREPAPDYGKDAELIKLLVPRERNKDATIDLSGNNELPALLEERESLRLRQKQDDERAKAIETQIKFTMGDAAIATGLPGWNISFRTTQFAGYTVAEQERRTLRIQRVK